MNSDENLAVFLCRCRPPDVVVFPRCLEEVSALAKVCHDQNLPIIPFGTGTGLEGGVGAVKVRKCQYFCHECISEKNITATKVSISKSMFRGVMVLIFKCITMFYRAKIKHLPS